MHYKNKVRSRISLLRVLSLLVPVILLIIGCQNKSTPLEPITIKIAGMDQIEYDNIYEPLLTKQLPNVQFEVELGPFGGVDLNEITSYMNAEQPDILIASNFTYPDIVKSGMVDSLDMLIDEKKAQSKFIQKLRSYSEDNQVYGWSSSFSSSALFYNKSLFDQYHVEYPREGISWGDMLKLAQQFPQKGEGGEPLFGYNSPGEQKPEKKIASLINQAGITEQLNLVNQSSDMLTINTKEWSQIWTSIIEAYQAGAISNTAVQENGIEEIKGTTIQEYYSDFIQGNAAMIIGRNDLLEELQDNSSFKWGITDSPGRYNSDIVPGMIYMINKLSAHKEEARQVIQALTSDEAAIYYMNLQGFKGTIAIPLNVKLLEDKLGMDLSAFYRKEPVKFDWWEVPVEFSRAYREIQEQEIKLILAGEQTVNQALIEIENKLAPEWKRTKS
ncbi:ABC transporter substrate-binding protein [Paenibacillus xylaniclasticus]|uniref:ABC transporter substrate-binding protein n=1 Tax=Paenibacillus xylaniclasticus TaxID=588083 RepID=UPI000FD9A18C|nr:MULTISPECIES: extracellular solute-binding protein [Paenibacillus]GFN33309.1 hypothetical protein PCURB6_35690 [Paenibacillus curdlanolyticus]